MLHHNHAQAPRRRAVILIVVLSLLSLLAILGLTFVNYAQFSKTGSNHFSHAWQKNNFGPNNATTADVDPQELFRFAMAQLIYPVADDATGVKSALRGHEMARNMYGYADGQLNTQPFSGTGRYHSVYTAPSPFIDPTFAPADNDDWRYINYTYFPTLPIRDPEYVGTRANPMAVRGTFVGGANPPVTYPNIDTLFLGASTAAGNQLIPSLHRPWLFGSMDPSATNPNWTNTLGKLLTLRPRPIDNLQTYPDGRPGFPYPTDAGGDVKNKMGAPGGNDSIWIDLGYPVRTMADGRRYKPLFAFLVEDLDGKINLNTSGNLMAYDAAAPSTNRIHASNQGWGKWEINMAHILNSNAAAREYVNLLLGNGVRPGRYGPDFMPTNVAGASNGRTTTRFLGQGDWDARDVANNYQLNGPITLAGLWPNYPAGYGSGSPQEHSNHASLFDYFRPTGRGGIWDDRLFPVSDMKKLMVNTWTSVDTSTGDVVTLCPNNFDVQLGGSAAQRRRNLVTTLSMQMGRLGKAPWLYGRNVGYTAPGNGSSPPRWSATPTLLTNPANNPVQRRGGYQTYYPNTNANFVEAIFEKVNIDRPLTRYPHLDGTYPPMAVPNANYARFDDPNYPVAAGKYQQAQADRQSLATDLLLRLLYVTGTPGPANVNAPTDAEMIPIRWMAQLATNIVDFIDEDDISTPLNFYYPAVYNYYASGNPPAMAPTMAEQTAFLNEGFNTTSMTNPGGELIPKYWVFGTELPSVVLNEVYTEFAYQIDGMNNPMSGNFPVKTWAELYCPFPATVPGTVQQRDALGVPLHMPAVAMPAPRPAYSPYRLVVASTTAVGLANRADNVLGVADTVRTQTDFPTPTVPTAGGGPPPPQVATAVSPQQGNGYFLVAPQTDTRGGTIAARTAVNTPNVPIYRTASMEYSPNYNAMTGTWSAPHTSDQPPAPPAATMLGRDGVTVLLRRLANPHLPEQNNPALPDYNPFITVDYLKGIVPQNATPIPAANAITATSYGKRQPYASLTGDTAMPTVTQVFEQNAPAMNLNQNTLGSGNVQPAPGGVNPTWLAHLDRTLASPFELLLVSGFRQHELTQQFITQNVAMGNAPDPQFTHKHRVPWFDEDLPVAVPPAVQETHRLYRLFGCLSTPDRANGVSQRGRIPGRININTIFDFETFAALCDRVNSNTFREDYNGAAPYLDPTVTAPFVTAPAQNDVVAAWVALMRTRSPNLQLGLSSDQTRYEHIPGLTSVIGQNDKPFLDLSTGTIPVGDGPSGAIPEGRGLEDTVFRRQEPGSQTNFRKLFQTNHQHPYFANELLFKIGQHITNKSNVFGVWLTVGYFKVVTVAGQDVLGEEIGQSQGGTTRHRFFSIVDRTQLVISPRAAIANGTPKTPALTPNPNLQELYLTGATYNAGPNTFTGLINAYSGSLSGTGQLTWTIQKGTVLILDRGLPTEETIMVEDVLPPDMMDPLPRIRATLIRERPSDASGNPIAFTINIPGNPGPQPDWNPNNPGENLVVPYWEMLN